MRDPAQYLYGRGRKPYVDEGRVIALFYDKDSNTGLAVGTGDLGNCGALDEVSFLGSGVVEGYSAAVVSGSLGQIRRDMHVGSSFSIPDENIHAGDFGRQRGVGTILTALSLPRSHPDRKRLERLISSRLNQ